MLDGVPGETPCAQPALTHGKLLLNNRLRPSEAQVPNQEQVKI
jgi:hypothetical protein